MSIEFPQERWSYCRERYSKWWDGTLEHPIVQAVLRGKDPGRELPRAPLLTQQTSLDLSIPAEDLIDRLDYELSQNIYLGDSFPSVNLDVFGPGVLAAFLGAEPDNHTGSIWFHPRERRPLDQLHFTYDPDNRWFLRIKALYRSAQDRWGSGVVLGMPDLGGTLDILATFAQTDQLLYDLYDAPEEVIRLSEEIHSLWLRYYWELNEVLDGANEGYTDWSNLLSAQPSYILQNDFSFMIGTEMFQEFALWDLKAFTEEIPNTIYHLDGPGEIKHLESVLQLKRLKAVQWVPGDGSPGLKHWPDLYLRIAEAGKRIYLWEDFDTLEAVAGQIGASRGIFLRRAMGDISEKEQVLRQLTGWGALSPWDRRDG